MTKQISIAILQYAHPKNHTAFVIANAFAIKDQLKDRGYKFNGADDWTLYIAKDASVIINELEALFSVDKDTLAAEIRDCLEQYANPIFTQIAKTYDNMQDAQAVLGPIAQRGQALHAECVAIVKSRNAA